MTLTGPPSGGWTFAAKDTVLTLEGVGPQPDFFAQSGSPTPTRTR